MPVLEDAAQAAGSTSARRPPGRAGHARDVLVLPVQEPRRLRRRRRDHDRATPRWPIASARCASTARPTRRPTTTSATTAASTRSRPRSCASSCPTSTPGPPPPRRRRRPLRRGARRPRRPCPAPRRAPAPPGTSTSSATPRADALQAALAAAGIGARPYYRTPVHAQPPMRQWAPAHPLPGTAEAARTHLAIPMGAALTAAQTDEVSDRDPGRGSLPPVSPVDRRARVAMVGTQPAHIAGYVPLTSSRAGFGPEAHGSHLTRAYRGLNASRDKPAPDALGNSHQPSSRRTRRSARGSAPAGRRPRGGRGTSRRCGAGPR